MHETYFEEMLKMGDTKDYKSKRPPNQLYAICKCKGRVPPDEPECIRNTERELAHRGQGWCLWFLPNGSAHCGHRFPPAEPDEGE